MERKLSDEQLGWAEQELRAGRSKAEVAADLGQSYGQLDGALTRFRRRIKSVVPQTPGSVHDFLELPPRPFEVPIPPAATKLDGQAVRAVVIGDRQVPFDDPQAFAIALGIIKDVKPHILLDMGDATDCWQISDYDKDPVRVTHLQDDIDMSRQRFAQLSDAASQARRVVLEGNHETRLQRLIWRLPGAARELPRLRVFQDTMTWPYLLGFKDIGWNYVPTDLQSGTPVLPKLISIHGHQLKGTITVEGGAARKAIQKYGKSVILGHQHRAAIIARRDHNGQSFGIETGCLCLLDGQPYGRDFNWQQCVTVIEWTKDHKVMAVQQVMIRDGRAMWRGEQLSARTA